MIERGLRLVAAIAAVGVLLIGAGPAWAVSPTSSSISSPGDHSRFFYDASAASSTVFMVTGTATGSGNLDVDCFDGNGTQYTLVSNVAPTIGNSFSVPITSSELNSAGFYHSGQDGTCVLRAVPTGSSTKYPPGSVSSFEGPLIAVTQRALFTNMGQATDYDYSMSGFAGVMRLEAAGDEGLGATLLEPTAFASSTPSFNGVGSYGEITVDGAEAFDASSAESSLPGYQGLTVSDSFDASTGDLTVSEAEPLLLCQPSVSICTSYTESGVEFDRTWQETQDGTVADQTDAFRSVDGNPHSLDAQLNDVIFSQAGFTGSGDVAGFKFVGSSTWQDYPQNATVSLPSGANSIYFKVDDNTPDAGDGVNPQGAISYAAAPSGPVEFTASDEDNSGNFPEFALPYDRTIPAGGQTVLRFSYAQAFDLTTAQTQAQAALARFAPQLAVTSPDDGATVDASTVSVSGTASDSVGIQSLTVQGRSVTVGAGGAWTAPVSLAPGANKITATLTGQDGDISQQQITITWSKLVIRSKLVVHRPSVSAREVKFGVSCEGVAGSVCQCQGQVVTVEKPGGKQIVGLVASERQRRRKQVILGSKRFSLKAGKTQAIVIELNGKTGRLLSQFRDVPALLNVTLLNTQPSTVSTTKITIKKARHRAGNARDAVQAGN